MKHQLKKKKKPRFLAKKELVEGPFSSWGIGIPFTISKDSKNLQKSELNALLIDSDICFFLSVSRV
jgi:hypothetical protein